MEYILAVLWYLTGVWGFAWWWTQDQDLTTDNIVFMLFIGLFGPLTWVIGWVIHSKDKHVILRKRK